MRVWLAWLVAMTAVALGADPAPAWAQEQETPLARGRYLGESIAACGNCHTPRDPKGEPIAGQTLAGGMVFDQPGAFRAIAPNITQDQETGIGRWSAAQIATALREGRRPDGTIIGPPMPMELYRDISDADIAALVAWLRSIPPVRSFSGRSRYQIPLPASYGPPVTSVPSLPADASATQRGAYLAGPLGHCIECHTPMGADGRRDWSRTGGGGPPIELPTGPVVPPNITPAALKSWTDSQIMRAITHGIRIDGRRMSPPMAYEYYGRMRLRDILDIVAYLRALKPVD